MSVTYEILSIFKFANAQEFGKRNSLILYAS